MLTKIIKEISSEQMVQALKKLQSYSIWRVIHPADGWLIIDLGEKYMSSFPSTGGIDEPYERGEYDLMIQSDWEIYSDNTVVAQREMGHETRHDYFTRMDELCSNFPIKKIETVTVKGNFIRLTEGKNEMRLPLTEPLDGIHLTYTELSALKKPKSYHHYRFDEELNSLTYAAVFV